MLGAVVVHPDKREGFALAPEPIVKGDGEKNNDCERNAAKRLLSDVRREHPHLKRVVEEDALASNGPHNKQLKGLGLRFILGAKRADHEALFEWVEATQRLKPSAVTPVEHSDEGGVHHRFRYLNGVPLNETPFELEVNFAGVLGAPARWAGVALRVGHRPAYLRTVAVRFAALDVSGGQAALPEVSDRRQCPARGIASCLKRAIVCRAEHGSLPVYQPYPLKDKLGRVDEFMKF